MLPLGLLDRPWFVRLIARGIDGVVAAVPLGWSEEQILSLRPYKWQATRVTCRLPQRVRQACGVERDDGQSLLSATRAVITRILQTNTWECPVLFSFGCRPSAWGTLDSNLQLHGFAQRLWPVAPEEPVALAACRELLLAPVTFDRVRDYADHPMSRARPVLENFRMALLKLAPGELEAGRTVEARQALAAAERFVPANVIPVPEGPRQGMVALRSRLDDGGP